MEEYKFDESKFIKESIENSNVEEKEKFYVKLKKIITQWAKKEGKDNKFKEYLLLLPNLFYLFINLMKDKEIDIKYKGKIMLILSYIILPLDIIPEALIGPIGYIDDLYIGLYFLSILLNELPKEKIYAYWKGDIKTLNNISEIIEFLKNNYEKLNIKSISKLISKILKEKYTK
ncbi:hypothetical protein JCM30566_19420 [Marinitoga arctica]